MAKKKEKPNYPKGDTVNEAMQICLANRVRVYPVINEGKDVPEEEKGKLKVQVMNNGRKSTYKELYGTKKDDQFKLNMKIIEIYQQYARMIIKEQEKFKKAS